MHGVHSPLVYNLIKDVIYNKNLKSPWFTSIEKIRNAFNNDYTLIDSIDYGAASKYKSTHKTIRKICSTTSKSKKYSQLLFRLIKWHNPKYALELGTSLGISAMYQATGLSENAKLITIEGHEAVALKAKHAIKELNFNSIEVIVGNFDKELPKVLNNVPQLDWVFFDGNHKKEPTLRYFTQCLEKASNNALFIFDDINWSDEMREAWIEIKNHPKAYLTIDLFFVGLVLVNKREQKEHFTILF